MAYFGHACLGATEDAIRARRLIRVDGGWTGSNRPAATIDLWLPSGRRGWYNLGKLSLRATGGELDSTGWSEVKVACRG